MFVNEFILEELLSEGGFAYDEYNSTNKVTMFIPSIDIDEKIKSENHNMLLYQGGMITHEEARLAVGKEPFTGSQEADTYLKNVTMPTLMLKGTVGGNGSAQSKDIPTNQHGTQLASPRIPQDGDLNDELQLQDTFDTPVLNELGMSHSSNIIDSHWQTMRTDFITILGSEDDKMDDVWIDGVQKQFVDDSIGVLAPILTNAYIQGAHSVLTDDVIIDNDQASLMQSDVEDTITQAKKSLQKLARTVARKINQKNITDSLDASTVSAIMDTYHHRIKMNLSTSLMRDYNFGRARMFQAQGQQELLIPACPGCNKGARTFPVVDNLTSLDIPPGSSHPNCNCLVTVPGRTAN
jgi:hypothetical protein